jgi:hypothetical protein
MARFAHYLYERGYVKLTDTPQLYAAFNDNHTGDLLWPKLIRRTVAEKMGVEDATAPKSFTVLDSSDALVKSWEKYLAGTDQYRAKVAAWEKKHDPQEKQPEPNVVISDLGKELSGSFEIFGDEPDHLTVKLAVSHAPIYSNGKWEDGYVTWDAQLDPARALPVFCCATWGDPDEAFQKNHFGAVVLTDDGLAEYCLWQNSLAATRVREWETFLSGLQPGGDLKQKVAQFQFAGASDSETNQLAIGRDRLVKALGN